MSNNILVQYVGFKPKALVREYTFNVLDAGELREFTLTIPNEDFESHRARYQDGPEICSVKLHQELAVNANRPPKTHYRITGEELDEYRESHLPKPVRNLYQPKPR